MISYISKVNTFRGRNETVDNVDEEIRINTNTQQRNNNNKKGRFKFLFFNAIPVWNLKFN